MKFVLERMKAVAGFAAPMITVAIIEGVCKYVLDVPFPDDAKTWVAAFVVSVVTGLTVHQTPNAS